MDPRVVDEARQDPARAQDRGHPGRRGRDGVGVADVEDQRGEERAALPAAAAAAADAALELLGVRGLAHGPEDVVPFRGQASRDGRADAAGDARDDDGAVEALRGRGRVAERVADGGKGRGSVGGGGVSPSSEQGVGSCLFACHGFFFLWEWLGREDGREVGGGGGRRGEKRE